MSNTVVLIGRLTKDVEVRAAGENKVANFTLAVNRNFKNAQGEREADFINCVVFRAQAENLAKFTKKGSQIAVEGRIQTRNYEKDGARIYVTEVVANNVTFLDSKGTNTQQEPNKQDAPPIDIPDSDLPF